MYKFSPPIEKFNWLNNVSQMFGVNGSYYKRFRNSKGVPLPGHNGLDVTGDAEKLGYGTKILAMHDFDTCGIETDFPTKTIGNIIRLYKNLDKPITVLGKEVWKVESIYAHLSDFAIKAGTNGKAGDVIGLMGNTGHVFPEPSNKCPLCPYYGTHTHVAWRAYDKKGKVIDNEYDGYLDPIPNIYAAGKLPIGFNRTLTIGSSGDDVSWLQTCLKIEGLAGDYEPLGYFGAKTLRDVSTLQSRLGWTPVGSVGPKTREYLNNKYGLSW